ncbi:ribosome-associated translation inhibitor RaiA [bacterium]|nr:ribosome-associated translation inhibitor RaiA [bacterium]MBU1072284.1 ribosome-associated translation inhibitor RaiA [bacterium]MBU1674749.1 ribosome-associated translation inhibitor RaiA [bacterium]
MQLEINSRHFALGDDMRDKIVEKLENLERYSPTEPVGARMTLTFAGGRFTGDLTYNIKHHSCHTKVEHVEPDTAAYLAIESIERQLRRHKDKMKDHRGRAAEGGLGEAMTLLSDNLLDNNGSAMTNDGFVLKDLTLAEAKEAYARSETPFFVFRNLDTAEVAVLYRKEDGQTGVMKPE